MIILRFWFNPRSQWIILDFRYALASPRLSSPATTSGEAADHLRRGGSREATLRGGARPTGGPVCRDKSAKNNGVLQFSGRISPKTRGCWQF